MLVCLISDIHGNLPALELVLKQTKGVDLYISLGDVVNYGPWSNECVDLLETVDNKILLKGNHEDYFIKNYYPGTNGIVKEFFNHCIIDFCRKETIKQYIEKFCLGGYTIVHTINDQKIFPDTAVSISKNMIIGHSHTQFIKKVNDYQLINPGSVGQNRTNIDAINYIIWNTITNKFKQFSFVYNVGVVVDKMKEKKYPKICLEYYIQKKT